MKESSMKKNEPPIEPDKIVAGVERHTYITREGGTLIITEPAAPVLKEKQDAQDTLGPAREG